MVLPTGEPAWLVTRYDDTVAVLKDERFVKNAANAMTPAELAQRPWFRRPWFRNRFRPVKSQLPYLDGQDYFRLRSLVNKAFTPWLVEQMRDCIQALAEELLEPALARGRLELIGEFALPLSLWVIAEILGVPAEERQAFQRWSEAIMSGSYSTWGAMKALPKALILMRYMRRLIRQRRAEPREDLVSALTRVEEAGDRLSEGELVGMVFVLLLVGYKTSVDLIGNGMLALLEHPDHLAKLRNDPALIKSAVEELLRFTSPAETTMERYAREDVRIGGVTIPRGEMVYVALASANRDERQFANADMLDITREPNKHLAFGLGTHFCVGAPLGRLVGQIAIGTLLRRLPDVRLAVAPNRLRWRRGLIMRGLEALPLAFGPANRPAKPDPLSTTRVA
jgi:cytochrome P450 PksS